MAMWNRAAECDDLHKFLQNPDAFVANTKCDKVFASNHAGHTIRLQMDGRAVIIKRFDKNTRSKIGKSYACRAWRAAHLLKSIGIATPEPIACIERHHPNVQSFGYYVSVFESAPTVSNKFGKAPPSERELAMLRELIHKLYYAGVNHGDLHANNLLITAHAISVVDCCAVKPRFFMRRVRNRAMRDMDKLLRHLRGNPAAHKAVADAVLPL